MTVAKAGRSVLGTLLSRRMTDMLLQYVMHHITLMADRYFHNLSYPFSCIRIRVRSMVKVGYACYILTVYIVRPRVLQQVAHTVHVMFPSV